MPLRFLSVPAFVLTLCASLTVDAHPRLVVLIVVDQLRGDLPLQMHDRFGPDGFRTFLDRGAAYTNAHYRHAITYTAAGHASIITGGNAREHGIVGNSWYDPKTGSSMYAVGDTRYKTLPERKPGRGTSPANLLSTTLGDELKWAHPSARVFSVSIKDRSAIIMGGRLGKSFWYDGSKGHFTSSTYYFDELPAWVTEWNNAEPARRYAHGAWDLLLNPEEYRHPDDRHEEVDNPRLGTIFPHSLAHLSGAALTGALGTTPFGDELTIEFTKALIREERLGADGVPDLLCLGLSVTDYIGHAFGPYSREQEDNLLRLDRALAGFIRYLDETVGLDRTLLVLTADHGVDGNPPFPDPDVAFGGQLDPGDVTKHAQRALGIVDGEDSGAATFYAPYVFFDTAVLANLGVSLEDAEKRVSEALLDLPGVAYAVPRTQLLEGTHDGSAMAQQIARSFHPKRSGHVFVVQAPYYRIFSGTPSSTATHGSPYPYDTYVPVYFAGADIEARRIARAAAPESIAPTITAILSITPPTGCSSEPLAEILAQVDAD